MVEIREIFDDYRDAFLKHYRIFSAKKRGFLVGVLWVFVVTIIAAVFLMVTITMRSLVLGIRRAASLALLRPILIRVSLRPSLHRPPGSFAEKALAFLFPRKHFQSHFAQAIADMREESFQADQAGETWRRRWIVFVSHFALALSVIAFLNVSFLKKALGFWKML